jgi:hypothetical protein
MTDQNRMDWLLDKCVSEGRITAAGRAEWAGRYLSDPAGTEAVLAALAPTPIGAGVLGHGTSDPIDSMRDTGIALARNKQSRRRSRNTGRFTTDGRSPMASAAGEPVQAEHMRPVEQPVSSIELTPENVARWTQELFPETRAGSGAQQGRVTRDAT